MASIYLRSCWVAVLLLIGQNCVVSLASADSSRVARVGEIWVQTEAAAAPYHQALAEGLRELGYVDGQNLKLFTRYANGDAARLPMLLDELISLRVDVLYVSSAAIDAARKATASIPIVCATMNDPVGAGLVTSLSRPGGNLTGISWQSVDTATKRLELAMELRPHLTRLAVLYQKGDREAQLEAELVSTAAREAGATVAAFEVQRLPDVQAAFRSMAKSRPQAVYVIETSFTAGVRKQIADLALEIGAPMISEGRVFAEAGGVLTYGAALQAALKRGAFYVHRILKGSKPDELPIEQPTKFELIVNLRTAKTLGLKVPQSILARADEVIE